MGPTLPRPLRWAARRTVGAGHGACVKRPESPIPLSLTRPTSRTTPEPTGGTVGSLTVPDAIPPSPPGARSSGRPQGSGRLLPPAQHGLGAAGRGAGRLQSPAPGNRGRGAPPSAPPPAPPPGKNARARAAPFICPTAAREGHAAPARVPPSQQRPPVGLPCAGAPAPGAGMVPWALPGASPARRPELSPSVRVRTVRRGRAPRSPGSSSGRGETLQNGDPSGTYLPVSGRAA